MRRTDYQTYIYNPIVGDKTKGFLDSKKLEDIKQNCFEINIPSGMEYRPDLIANHYLGSVNYAWLITYVNSFLNGIIEYTPGRKIKIPSI